MSVKHISRRDFLRYAGAGAAGALLAACQPKTQVVEKQVTVEKVVKETVLVEKEQAVRIPEPVTLEVWTGWSPVNTENMRIILDRFKEDNPNFSYELTMAADEIKFLSSATAGVPPDLYVSMWNMYIAQWAREKAVLPLDDFVDASNFDLDSQLKAGLDGCRWLDGKLYGMAWGTDCTGFMWNKDEFAEAGLDPEVPPKTWEEVFLFAEKLTKMEGSNLVQAGYIPNFGCCLGMYGYIKSFGGDPYSADFTTLTLNTPEAQRALEYEKSYYDKFGADNLDRLMATFGDGAQAGHYSGKISMFLAGEWTPRYAGVYEVKWNYGIAPVPAPADKPELLGVTPVSGTANVIPAAAKHPKEAWELFMFLAGPWATAVRMKDEGNIPTHVENLNDPRFTEDAALYTYMQYAFGKNAYAPPLTPISIELDDETGRITELALHGGIGIEEGLKEIENKLQPELEKGLTGG
jgi:multiple sugar transport system substrate-binding protein